MDTNKSSANRAPNTDSLLEPPAPRSPSLTDHNDIRQKFLRKLANTDALAIATAERGRLRAHAQQQLENAAGHIRIRGRSACHTARLRLPSVVLDLGPWNEALRMAITPLSDSLNIE